MKFKNTDVWGFEHAIRGMRNPLESWSKSDSCFTTAKDQDVNGFSVAKISKLGQNDLELMQKLIRAGSEHRKFMRQIMVSVDITAPLYWWKEFDTYKIGTVANSTSTMHKLASTPITKDCFEMGDFVDLDDIGYMQNCPMSIGYYWYNTIQYMELVRKKFNETKDKRYWKELIRLLPESWLQTRTVTMNYENLLSMVHQRKNHKLSEWSVDFISWTRGLPYAKELIFADEVKE